MLRNGLETCAVRRVFDPQWDRSPRGLTEGPVFSDLYASWALRKCLGVSGRFNIARSRS